MTTYTGRKPLGTPEPDVNLTEPFAVRIEEAVRISGFGRSEIYKRAAAGQIVFRKNGQATLVDFASLRAAYESLPRAVLTNSAA